MRTSKPRWKPIEHHYDLDRENIRKSRMVLRAIDHPIRMKIVEFLIAEPDSSVTDINFKLLYNHSQPEVSQQLAILRRAKIIIPERKGKFVFYNVNEKMIKNIEKARKYLQPA